MKLRLVRVKLFLVNGQIDRQTDIRNLEVAFPSFVNTPTKRSRVAAAQMTRLIPVDDSLLYVKGGICVLYTRAPCIVQTVGVYLVYDHGHYILIICFSVLCFIRSSLCCLGYAVFQLVQALR